MAAHGDFHSCPPPALLLSSCGPSRSTRVWGERATRRDLLSPCPVQASMIAHFLARERGPGRRSPCQLKQGQMALLLGSPAHRKPRLSRGHRAHALLTAAGRGALLLCGTAVSKNGSTSGSERPPESG